MLRPPRPAPGLLSTHFNKVKPINAIVDNRDRPLTSEDQTYQFDLLSELVQNRPVDESIGKYIVHENPLADETGLPEPLTAGAVRYLLSSKGLIAGHDSLMRLAYNTFLLTDSAHDIGGDKDTDIPVLIDHWAFRDFPFMSGLLPSGINMHGLKPLLQKAIKGGTAIVVAETKTTGFENNPQVLNHYVCYALFGLDRLANITSSFDASQPQTQPHVAVFESSRAAGRQEWDTRFFRAQATMAPKDEIVVDGIVKAFNWAAYQLRPAKERNSKLLPQFRFHSLPAPRQGADRGCTLFAIVSAHAVAAVRGEILEALDAAPYELRHETSNCTNKDELWDKVEDALKSVGWGPEAQIEISYSGPARRLYDAAYSNKSGPTIFDTVVWELFVRAVFLAAFGNVDVLHHRSDSLG
ncbi:hypothetical protein QFC24_006437 [Naganishia onofrii]|uniref:Uncharacterized protein n=1 Tax=Naganishia onofrii TaxID=1851511 RepID=A0ACC2X0P7_9TREE|nr:hypothetical protein QFC24_006437 [Naganishia onofrii]